MAYRAAADRILAAETFARTFAAARLFRRRGLPAAILMRPGHYLIWHVLDGNFLA